MGGTTDGAFCSNAGLCVGARSGAAPLARNSKAELSLERAEASWS
jgi:hypothetical protein